MTKDTKENMGKRTEKNGRKKKRLSKPRLLIFIAALVLILGCGAILVNGFLNPPIERAEGDDPDDEKVVIKGRKNVLLIGVDSREGEGMARADTIMLASLDTDLKKAVLVSVPRDTRVEIPRHGMDKINSATIYGGPEMLLETVSDLFNIRMDGYVLCDYDGFIEIIDALGGVTMDIDERMYHHDPADNGKYIINLPAGEQQHLDGNKALQFVRYRSYDLADITRTQQQQKFISALAGQIAQTNTIARLPKLVPTIIKNIKTNLGYSEIMALAKAAKQFKDIDIASQTLPGYFLELDGLSYWETNEREASSLIARLYEGEDINQVVWGAKVIKTDIASSGDKPANTATPDSSELEDDPDIEIKPVEPGNGEGTGDENQTDDWWNDENIEEWWGQDSQDSNGNSGNGSGPAGNAVSETGSEGANSGNNVGGTDANWGGNAGDTGDTGNAGNSGIESSMGGGYAEAGGGNAGNTGSSTGGTDGIVGNTVGNEGNAGNAGSTGSSTGGAGSLVGGVGGSSPDDIQIIKIL